MNLPKPTVEYSTTDDLDFHSGNQLKGMFCNPVYVGVGPYPPIMNDKQWIGCAVKEIEDDGAEQFLVNMLFMLRESLKP